MPQHPEISQEFVDELLSLSDREQKANFLREADLLNADGLDRLLDEADRLLGSDPDKAEGLAKLCIRLADHANAPAAVPRANYICAGVSNLSGDLETDLHLTSVAYEEYIALGMNFEALRTNVGRMTALVHLGHYKEALNIGQTILDTLNGEGEVEVTPTQQQTKLLTALVQQNRAACLDHMASYEEALDSYATSEELYRNLGMTERIADVSTNRGVILSLLGRASEALAAHKEAAQTYEGTGATIAYALALHNIGEVYLRQANYVHGLSTLEQVRRLYGSHKELAYNHILVLDIADGYMALNMYSEALDAYREAEHLLQNAGIAHDHARALWGVGSASIAKGELEEAELALAKAARLFEEAGNMSLFSGVLLEQVSLLEICGENQEALATARRALELVSDHDWPIQRFYAHLRLAGLLLPDTANAELHLLEAQHIVKRLSLRQLRYQLDERFGRLRRIQGRDEEAQELFETAIKEIESLRGNVVQDVMRSSFLRDKTTAYEELLHLYLDQDSEEGTRNAFIVAERAKSRSLVDLLTGVAIRDSTSTDPELQERLQDLQADLNAVYSRLLHAEEGTRKMTFSPLNDRATELEQEISRLWLQAAASATASDLPAFSSPLETTVETAPPGVTLVAYHTVGEEVLAFVTTQDSIRVVRHLSTISKVQQLLQQLTVQWERVQAGGRLTHRRARLLEKSAQRVLGALYDELAAPLEELIGEDSLSSEPYTLANLTVVPHGLLHQVPFHALFDGERHLLERFEISYAPSATVYAICQERTSQDLSNPGKSLVMGVEDPTIPNATGEAHTVAEHLTGAEVRVGSQATVTALYEEASGCDILHLACHGLFRNDNPMFSSLKLDDGWAMAADALKLDLDGALVTLSACESGKSEVIGGDEILGLTRAFLGAGAATLAVSLWLVQDETTAELMDAWYRRLRGGVGRSSALREAQLEIKDRYPHPYYWAPFVLIGSR
ncbi:MAG: CHAT domain-containing protein [Rubrobacteraceae bacterium]